MNAICIKCWNPEALVKMHLDGTGEFECAECLAAMQGKWAKLIKWAESYPTVEA